MKPASDIDGRARRALEAARLPSRSVSLLVLGGAFAACWIVAVGSRSAVAVSRHWFYVPIVLAAFRFGAPGGAVAGVVASLLAGPLVPGLDAAPVAWTTRGAFFLIIGGLVGVLADLGRRATDREVQVARREQRLLEQQSTLIRTVSHEFRTPLTVIHGISQTLNRRDQLVDGRLRPLLPGLKRACDRLSDMITVVLAAGDALDVGLRQQQAPVEIDRLVATVAEELRDLGGPERVYLALEPGDRLVVSVQAYLRVALLAVIENALRFSPREEPVIVQAHLRDDEMRIRVRDRGPGLAKDYLTDAFQPFSQQDSSLSREHGGLGLGLFSARQVVERLGGRIDIVNNADVGATVHITVPQRRENDAAKRPRAA